MARPMLVTRFRTSGACEVFQNVDGTLTSLFTYGDGTLVTSPDYTYGALSTHWRGSIYSIGPADGIYKNIPPSTTATQIHAFTSPHTLQPNTMDWQVVFKDGKQQLMTLFHTSTANNIRMVFVDEEDNVTETDTITLPTLHAAQQAFGHGVNFGNKIFSANAIRGLVQISDPVAEGVQFVQTEITGQSDIAMHSGIMYAYLLKGDTTIGEGNILYNISSAVPYIELEWEAYQPTSNEFPGDQSQNCIFSDGENLICIGYSDGSTVNEIGVFKINFDAQGIVSGYTNITSTVLGFTGVPNYENMRIFASRDIESELGEIKTTINMGLYPNNQAPSAGTPIHSYEWNGPNQRATYIGLWGDEFDFDSPSYRVGGGARTFSNQDELDFTITNVAPTGSSLDITYVLNGSVLPSGAAMCIKYNSFKDSPLIPATVTPITNGVSSGNYIANLSTGESGVFRWNIASDGISPGDVPNIGAYLIRTR